MVKKELQPRKAPRLTIEPNISVGQRKLQLLMLDEAFWKELQPVSRDISLEHQGNGHYAARTDAAKPPGIYRAVFKI